MSISMTGLIQQVSKDIWMTEKNVIIIPFHPLSQGRHNMPFSSIHLILSFLFLRFFLANNAYERMTGMLGLSRYTLNRRCHELCDMQVWQLTELNSALLQLSVKEWDNDMPGLLRSLVWNKIIFCFKEKNILSSTLQWKTNKLENVGNQKFNINEHLNKGHELMTKHTGQRKRIIKARPFYFINKISSLTIDKFSKKLGRFHWKKKYSLIRRKDWDSILLTGIFSGPIPNWYLITFQRSLVLWKRPRLTNQTEIFFSLGWLALWHSCNLIGWIILCENFDDFRNNDIKLTIHAFNAFSCRNGNEISFWNFLSVSYIIHIYR